MTHDILIAEISGKRPGTSKQRTSEGMDWGDYDKVIISNNSEGYETDWQIVDVPQDYREYYERNFRTSSGGAWLAPMNRSYAIKYAREHGYKYLVQIDDNIRQLGIEYRLERDGYFAVYRAHAEPVDFIEMMTCVLSETNAGIVGCSLLGVSLPDADFLRERYCYSFFAMNLERIPDEYHGDFEDDIEFRYKLLQMGVPMVQISPLRYIKISQNENSAKHKEDLTGNRAEYAKAGVQRGDKMSVLYGDLYRRGQQNHNRSILGKAESDKLYFKHKLATFELGVLVRQGGMERIKNCMRALLERRANTNIENAVKIKN